jgi:hypothetical protein
MLASTKPHPHQVKAAERQDPGYENLFPPVTYAPALMRSDKFIDIPQRENDLSDVSVLISDAGWIGADGPGRGAITVQFDLAGGDDVLRISKARQRLGKEGLDRRIVIGRAAEHRVVHPRVWSENGVQLIPNARIDRMTVSDQYVVDLTTIGDLLQRQYGTDPSYASHGWSSQHRN